MVCDRVASCSNQLLVSTVSGVKHTLSLLLDGVGSILVLLGCLSAGGARTRLHPETQKHSVCQTNRKWALAGKKPTPTHLYQPSQQTSGGRGRSTCRSHHQQAQLVSLVNPGAQSPNSQQQCSWADIAVHLSAQAQHSHSTGSRP